MAQVSHCPDGLEYPVLPAPGPWPLVSEPRSQRPGLRMSGVKLSGDSNSSSAGEVTGCPTAGPGESLLQLPRTYASLCFRLKIKPRARCGRKRASLPGHLLKLITRPARHVVWIFPDSWETRFPSEAAPRTSRELRQLPGAGRSPRRPTSRLAPPWPSRRPVSRGISAQGSTSRCRSGGQAGGSFLASPGGGLQRSPAPEGRARGGEAASGEGRGTFWSWGRRAPA